MDKRADDPQIIDRVKDLLGKEGFEQAFAQTPLCPGDLAPGR